MSLINEALKRAAVEKHNTPPGSAPAGDTPDRQAKRRGGSGTYQIVIGSAAKSISPRNCVPLNTVPLLLRTSERYSRVGSGHVPRSLGFANGPYFRSSAGTRVRLR